MNQKLIIMLPTPKGTSPSAEKAHYEKMKKLRDIALNKIKFQLSRDKIDEVMQRHDDEPNEVEFDQLAEVVKEIEMISNLDNLFEYCIHEALVDQHSNPLDFINLYQKHYLDAYWEVFNNSKRPETHE